MPKVITAPTEEPVTVTEAKLHLRVDQDEEDAYILGLIATAREYCELVQNRAYVTQTLEETWAYWEKPLVLPRPPLQSVTTVTYKDFDGTEHTVDSADYAVDNEGYKGEIVPFVSWPAFVKYPVNAIRVKYIAGYGTAADVPRTVKQAILLLVAELYESRENAIEKVRHETIMGVHRLLQLERVW